MSGDKVTRLDQFPAPFNKSVEIQEVEYESGGLPMLRLRIREGNRFTIMDLDWDTAEHWGRAMLGWAASRKGAAGLTKG